MATFYVTHWHKNTPKQDKDLLQWDLYEVKNGEYIKITTFKEGKLQFSENEIGKQYIVVGYLYEPELNNASAMKISVIPTEKVQILSVEVRDINGNKITKPLAYGQKIKVSVRTTGLQGAKLNIDLWEDDEKGSGHNEKNTKIPIPETSRFASVNKNGIATTEILIPVNFKKYAEAHGDKGKDSAEHEYYVTAYFDGTQREASGNINFTNTKTPTQRKEETRDHLEQKPKRTEPVRGHRGRARKEPPTPTPSRSTPAPASPPAQQQPSQPRAVKKEITTVYITDANDKKISGTVKSGIVKVHILSTGLVGRDIRFKFYEEDVTENELVFEQKFKITKDHFIVDVTLNKVSANKGDDYFEGSEQEFFVDIEVLDTHAHIKSAVIDVDVKALKQDIPTNVTKTKVEQQEAGKNQSCGERYCIKKGDKSELIREINIRLAGFGGNEPTDEFTERTERMVKQFQRDYMKVPETGKVCGNVLLAIDGFQKKYTINFEKLKCKCSTKGKSTNDLVAGKNNINICNSYGDGSNKNIYKHVKKINGKKIISFNNQKNGESMHAYEYPGIHRSLLFGLKAIMFYTERSESKYKFNSISSGYRCRYHSIFLDTQTTNHMGKALDLLFNDDKGVRAKEKNQVNAIRKDYFEKYLGATYWSKNSKGERCFGLETYEQGARTWVHVDVREFDEKYLENIYFVKNTNDLEGKNIIQLANELGFKNTCLCVSKGNNNTSEKKPEVKKGTCEDKFKKVAPIILRHEGGYVNDPDDSGGETNKGITIGTFKKYAKEDLGIEPTSKNLKEITDDQATIIYRKRYWEPKGFCKVEDDKVGLMVYDWTITSGGAGKKVQELLINEFNQKITADGDIGDKTIQAINNVEDRDKLLKRIGEIRKEYYTNLAYDEKGNPTKNHKFLKGWLNRVDDCLNINI